MKYESVVLGEIQYADLKMADLKKNRQAIFESAYCSGQASYVWTLDRQRYRFMAVLSLKYCIIRVIYILF